LSSLTDVEGGPMTSSSHLTLKLPFLQSQSKNAFSHCENLVNVSSLSSVYDLNLSHCKRIVDMSALGGVHDLDLSSCCEITDVSSLCNAHI
jgi:hypothetical protein